ncbi:MAG TPA: DUF4233 domain-containing protein [Jatrophihabitans sp.]|nr:DUF4233 domain-containing protein [Jatrophihabitans sp.]
MSDHQWQRPAGPGEPPAEDREQSSGSAAEVQPPAPDPDRARRADRATRGGLAGLLCLEAFVVLLVPRAIAQTSTGLDATKTWTLVGLAVVLIGAGFLLRRPWGIGVGSALQLVLALTIVLIPVIAVVVVFFLLIWWYVLRTRHQLVGTPSGWRMLVS